ncbi:hypothetical protein GE061_008673, partial [Apolygus lucorum]
MFTRQDEEDEERIGVIKRRNVVTLALTSLNNLYQGNDVMSDDEDCDERDYLLQDSDDVTFIRPKRNRAMGFFDSLKYVFCCRSCCFGRRCCPKSEAKTRMIKIGESPGLKFPPNVIRNQKYNVFTFLPLVLYEQFKFFLNFYFLVMAMSQLIPCLVVGSLYTYWGPLGFVVTATIVREAIDDLRRWKRDKEVNGQKYSRVKKRPDGVVVTEQIPSSEISVGDLIYIEKDQRVPADLVLLRTTDKTGSCFVRTDQLDGETDWKCRVAIPPTQMIESDAALIQRGFSIFVEKPDKDIHSFIGNFIVDDRPMGLSIQYTLWANTVLAAGTALGLVVYTGKETRSCMNNSQPRSKNGLLDQEINTLTKVLFVAVIGLALIMMCLKGFNGPLYGGVYMFRFVLLFSYIIPLSLRVNLEFAKMFYSWQMSHDQDMPGFVVRCTTIPEELGRISYLLSDKTGTLTKNSMNFKKLSMGVDKKYTVDDESVENELREHFGSTSTDPVITVKGQHTLAEAVLALAICHNVTPVFEVEDVESVRHPLQWQCSVDSEYFASKKSSGVSYQASSPDEIALVSWADSVGLALIKRDRHMMQLRTPQNDVISYTILQLFPFTSESKRMGIIVRNDETNEITFFMKGADMVMREIVRRQNWLDEVVNTMAEEGLRTLVVAQKSLTLEEYNDFEAKYQAAGAVTSSRELAMAAALADLEKNMDLLCVTGVEDELQDLVKQTLEVLRAAGIKIWMLTGDKLETAVCIAKSSNLVDRINKDSIFVFNEVTSTEDEQRTEVNTLINEASNRPKSVLVITGTTMEKCLKYYKSEFMEILCAASSVVVCRCSPTQKSQVVELIRKYTNKRTAAIGDGGNDVSMIQAADVGIGIAGKE